VAVYGRYGKPCYRCGTTVEVRRHGEQSRVTYWCPECQQRQVPLVPAWARADAPTPVDLVTARDRRRPPPVVFDDTGDISGPIDPADVVPALERHPASQALLAGFQPRGPEPIFVDPLLGREPEAAKARDDEGDDQGDDATGAVP
jgi:hypothetical protein